MTLYILSGWWKMNSFAFANYSETIDVAIIQPNIDPYNEKFNRSNEQNLKYLESVLDDVKNRNSLVILPETYFSDGSLISSLNYSSLINKLYTIKEKYDTEI